MATAQIAPVGSAEIGQSGHTLAEAAEQREITESFVVSSADGATLREQAPALGIKSTQSPITVSVTTVQEFPSALPDRVRFGANLHPTLRLRKAIPLSVCTEEQHIVVNWEQTNEFACGATLGEALDDFSKTITELYFELNKPDIQLGADLQRVRGTLGEYIEQRGVR